MFCVHYTIMHQINVTLFKATYVGCMRLAGTMTGIVYVLLQ